MRKRQGGQSNPELATRSRHLDIGIAAPPACPASPDAGCGVDGTNRPLVEERDPVASIADVALPAFSWAHHYAVVICRAEDGLSAVSALDQQPLEPPADSRATDGSSSETNESSPLGALDVHSQPRSRRLVRLRQWWERSLRRTADDEPLGARRLLRLPGRPTESLRADAKGRARLSGERLLADVADGPVVPPGVPALRITDSEGNEDPQTRARRGHSAAGDVRPVSVTAVCGLGGYAPHTVSCLSPRVTYGRLW